MPPDAPFMDTTEDVKRVLEGHRTALGVSKRALSLRAGFAHSTYCRWHSEPNTDISLEAALCYLRVLGLRVALVSDKPMLIGRTKK